MLDSSRRGAALLLRVSGFWSAPEKGSRAASLVGFFHP
jgi:hypothetical protein